VANVHYGFITDDEVQTGIQRALMTLSPTVVRIRYSFEDDSTGDPSIFFRIVLSDDVAKMPALIDVVQNAKDILRREVRAEESGLHAYFNFRSLSEQSEMPEAAWA
jgi:hypothetical protein